MKSLGIPSTVIILSVFFLLGLSGPGQSQNLDESPAFSQEQLAQMLAPIALYPDALLSQVLMASTYPIEVIEADRWLKKNPALKGDNLDNVLLDMDWDPSVKALCHFPTVLALMSENISETTNIGNAFLAQEGDVLAMVQVLRTKAYEQGNLNSSAEQKVIVERQTIIIQPVDPRIIYVPYYDPFYIYGTWWYPAYPPYYWGPRRDSIGIGIYNFPRFYFSFAFGAWSSFDWHHHYIHIDSHRRPRYVRDHRWRYDSDRWSHFPHHRRGVAYRDRDTARKYGQHPYPPRDFDRRIRGYPDHRDGDRDRNRDMTRDHRDRKIQDRPMPKWPPGDKPRQEPPRPQIRDEAGRVQPPAMKKEKYPPQHVPAGPALKVPDQRRQYQQPTVRDSVGIDHNIFNQVDQGRRERESSERGRMSRENNPANDYMNLSPGGDRGVRDSRGRSGR